MTMTLPKFFLPVLFVLLCVDKPLQACDFCHAALGINPYYNQKNRLTVNFLFQRSRFTLFQTVNQVMLGAFRLTLTELLPLTQSRPALSMREEVRLLAGLRVEF